MLEVNFYENVADELLKFAVIISKTNGKCDGNGNVLVQDKKNHPTWYGWNFLGGHVEKGEYVTPSVIPIDVHTPMWLWSRGKFAINIF